MRRVQAACDQHGYHQLAILIRKRGLHHPANAVATHRTAHVFREHRIGLHIHGVIHHVDGTLRSQRRAREHRFQIVSLGNAIYYIECAGHGLYVGESLVCGCVRVEKFPNRSKLIHDVEFGELSIGQIDAEGPIQCAGDVFSARCLESRIRVRCE